MLDSEAKKVVFVLGMHRSGTSLLASVINLFGYSIGKTLIKPNEENPIGFFENEKIVQFNDKLLEKIGASWDSVGFLWEVDYKSEKFTSFVNDACELIETEFKNSECILIKDPRLCLILPFWMMVFSTNKKAVVKYIMSLRHPLDCALSQRKRNKADPYFHVIGEDLKEVIILWSTYIWRVVTSLNDQEVLIVDYDKLIDSNANELKRISKFLGMDYIKENIQSHFEENLLDASLRHANSQNFVHSYEHMEALETFQILNMYSTGGAVKASMLSEKINDASNDHDYTFEVLVILQRLYVRLYRSSIEIRSALISSMRELDIYREKDYIGQIELLDKKIKEVELENELMRKKVQEGKEEVLAKQNEISILQNSLFFKVRRLIIDSSIKKLIARIKYYVNNIFREK